MMSLLKRIFALFLLLTLCTAAFAAPEAGTPAIRSLPKHRSQKYGSPSRLLARKAAGMKFKRDLAAMPLVKKSQKVKPKIMLIAMFIYEANSFLDNYKPTLYGMNITVPGFSPLFPEVHCTAKGDVCHLTTGEAEINAASTISALVYSHLFDLTETYFMVGGIAGINPHVGTTGSVTFAKYAVQFALEYEIDGRSLPAGIEFGYLPQGTTDLKDNEYPAEIYGTEVFELNENLRNRVYRIAKRAKLADGPDAEAYRALYGYAPANQKPSVIRCDTGTSDVYWTGYRLGYGFGNLTTLLTNGTGNYCTTQQEDNATMEALVRAAAHKLVDFGRVIIMRTASDFDRAPPGMDELYHLLDANQGGFVPSIQNIFLAGSEIVHDILTFWDTKYGPGWPLTNYIGDLFNTLDSPSGFEPNIGVESVYLH